MANNTPPPPPPKKSKRIVRDTNRGKWRSKSEFILSLIGYAIGIGNVWRFPYLCYRSGGGAFLVPYILMVLLAGIPLFYMEVLIGQFSSTGCTGMFRLAPIFKGTGIAQVIVNMYCVCYYSVIISYPIRMISYCFYKQVPWVDCDHSWNTDHCVSIDELSKQNSTGFVTSADEFFHREVLQLSPGIAHLDGIVWQQTLSLFLAWIVIYLCVAKGIQSVGKVVYFTAPFPYVLLFILFVRGVTLPGAWTGIKFYMYPEWNRLLDLKVWADAAVQMFFGLGPGWGGIVNMASFSDFRNNAKFDSILIVTVNVFTSIFAGFVVFSVLGFLSVKSGIPVATVATSGPGLAFVTYPEAIAKLPVPQMWAIMFFFMLFLLGIDSVFVQLEAITSSMLDEVKWFRNHKWKLTFVCCFVFFLGAIIMTTRGGMYILQLFDWYSSAISVIAICLVEIIMVSFIYGIDNFMLDVEFMMGKRPSLLWKILWKWVTPVVLIFIFFTSIIFIRTIQYHNTIYPQWAIIIGWASFGSSVMWIPLYVLYIMIRKRETMFDSLKKRLKPLDWTPADPEDREQYEAFRRQRRMPAFMSDTDAEAMK
ncbi:sodium- and chloride-dependent glycine transporter 2 [Drosophila subobscura]|uniref:sodium- and chloride-dependent glycine transporter 2 n=1 Tax=Drosophila subobscura TaxID=7241 RepID=UPI00155A25EA|nr:sodium- and chloride-dependent glycine transporter 2 [Drosophila subobscura]